MINYVLGFAFSIDLKNVLLIDKNRPAWQAGRLNGIGGHIEDKELAVDAMSREFKEECGIIIPANKWIFKCDMTGIDWMVRVFYTLTNEIYNYKDQTDEKCIVCNTHDLPIECLPNLRWLVPFCLDAEVLPGTIIMRYCQK